MEHFEIVSAEMTDNIEALRPGDIALDNVPIEEGCLVQAGALEAQKSKDSFTLRVHVSKQRRRLTIARPNNEPFGIVHYFTNEETIDDERELVFSPPYLSSIVLQRIAGEAWSVHLKNSQSESSTVKVVDPKGLHVFIGKVIEFGEIQQQSQSKK